MRQSSLKPPRLTRLALLGAALLGVFLLLSIDMGTRNHTGKAMLGVADRVGLLPTTSSRWRGWHSLLGAKDTEDQAALRAWEIARATQHTGTGARIHRFLEKAKRGEPYTVAAMGGSGECRVMPKGLQPNSFQVPNNLTAQALTPVSKGRGLVNPSPEDHVHPPSSEGETAPMGASTLYSPENLHVLVFEWLNATFPHRDNVFVNGAQGGVGAGYFAWCFKEHIAPAPDLVLIELGINDLLSLDVVPKYEHLVRSVLELDSAPAVINVETFTTLFPSLVSSSALHADVLSYYDVPSLSIRDILMPRILADPDVQLPRWFRTGGDVKLGDDKVREWGGVAVDLMHVSSDFSCSFSCSFLLFSFPNEGLTPDLSQGPRPSRRPHYQLPQPAALHRLPRRPTWPAGRQTPATSPAGLRRPVYEPDRVLQSLRHARPPPTNLPLDELSAATSPRLWRRDCGLRR